MQATHTHTHTCFGLGALFPAPQYGGILLGVDVHWFFGEISLQCNALLLLLRMDGSKVGRVVCARLVLHGRWIDSASSCVSRRRHIRHPDGDCGSHVNSSVSSLGVVHHQWISRTRRWHAHSSIIGMSGGF